MNHRILHVLFISLLFSCTSQQRLRNIDYASLYNSPKLYPDFRIYHFSSDSSLIYFSIPAGELIFKNNEVGFFESRFGLGYSLHSSYHNTSILDSSSFNYSFLFDSIAVNYKGVLKLRVPAGNNYILKILYSDLNTIQSYNTTLEIKKQNNRSSQYFNVSDQFGSPLVQNYTDKDHILKISPPENAITISKRSYFRNFPLAAPPFSENPLPVFEYGADKINSYGSNELNMVQFEKNGFYHFQTDTLSKAGLTIFCFDTDFPLITRPPQLIEALRYLCTIKEYNELSAARDQKKAVDDYWLGKAGNNERGRKLIRVYYRRVYEANKLFTSYTEGWKTDRGMIYMIFGPPQSVYRDNKYETWRYNSSNGQPATQFVFNKINNPFTENDFQLERHRGLQDPWYMAVDRWRAGMIVGEY